MFLDVGQGGPCMVPFQGTVNQRKCMISLTNGGFFFKEVLSPIRSYRGMGNHGKCIGPLMRTITKDTGRPAWQETHSFKRNEVSFVQIHGRMRSTRHALNKIFMYFEDFRFTHRSTSGSNNAGFLVLIESPTSGSSLDF